MVCYRASKTPIGGLLPFVFVVVVKISFILCILAGREAREEDYKEFSNLFML